MWENLAPEQLGLAGIRPFLEAAPPVRAEPEGIGAPLSRMRQRLVKCGQTLSGLVEPAGQALVSGHGEGGAGTLSPPPACGVGASPG